MVSYPGQNLHETNFEPLLEAAGAMQTGTFDPARLDDLAERPGPMGQLAQALQKMARGISEREERLRRDCEGEAQLLEITNDLASELNLGPLLKKIMETAQRLLDAERSTLFMYDEKTDELWSHLALGLEIQEIRFPAGMGIAGAVFSTGDTINITDAYKDERFNKDFDKETGFRTRSTLTVPVINKDGVKIGVLQVLNKRTGPFSPADEKRLRAFASQVSIALENAQIHDNLEKKVSERTKDLRLANDLLKEEIQERRRTQEKLVSELSEAAEYVKKLLPAPVEEGPIRIDWRFIPSTSLGGDSFGYHWLDRDHFAFYLVDVCGHGVGAALLAVSILNVLRSQSLPVVDFKDPSQVLGGLNNAFPMEKHNFMYFTIWYGVYNPINHQLKYAGGGHPPALLFQESPSTASSAVQLETANTFIGGIPNIVYESKAMTFEGPGRLYVFSDGVFEIKTGEKDWWAFSDFVAFLSKPAPEGLSEIDLLFDHVQSISHSGLLDDDFSIMEIRFESFPGERP